MRQFFLVVVLAVSLPVVVRVYPTVYGSDGFNDFL